MNICPECECPMAAFECRCGYKVKRGESWQKARAKIMETPKTSKEVAVSKISAILDQFPKYRRRVGE